jgi:hypothetical protein
VALMDCCGRDLLMAIYTISLKFSFRNLRFFHAEGFRLLTQFL